MVSVIVCISLMIGFKCCIIYLFLYIYSLTIVKQYMFNTFYKHWNKIDEQKAFSTECLNLWLRLFARTKIATLLMVLLLKLMEHLTLSDTLLTDGNPPGGSWDYCCWRNRLSYVVIDEPKEFFRYDPLVKPYINKYFNLLFSVLYPIILKTQKKTCFRYFGKPEYRI